MKYTLTLFSLSALMLFAFDAPTDTFKASFQKVFLQSIKGLQGASDSSIAGFEKTIIAKDEVSGLWAATATKSFDTEEAAKKEMENLEKNVLASIPAADFVKSETYSANYVGYMKTIYDFNSTKMADKQKRPTIEMGVVKADGKFVLTLSIIEPFFKNQYKPAMP